MNKVYLPELKDLKKRLKDDPESFKRWISKADALIGSTQSMDFIDQYRKRKLKQ